MPTSTLLFAAIFSLLLCLDGSVYAQEGGDSGMFGTTNNQFNAFRTRPVIRNSTIYGPVTQEVHIWADQRRFRRSFIFRKNGRFSFLTR